MNEITLMMIDKPYYDYDYEYVKEKKNRPCDRKVWSDDRVNALLMPAARKYEKESGRGRKGGDLAQAEAMQRDAMRAIAKEKSRGKKIV